MVSPRLLRHRASVSGRLSGLRLGALAFLVIESGSVIACGGGTVADPFGAGARAGFGGEAGEGGGLADGGESGLPGEECSEDAQCDDGLACTSDVCDEKIRRCAHVPDDAACDNGVYCDGPEVCDVTLGCQRGRVVSCSDDSVCSIDTCVEETQSCKHEPRDADGDGDPGLSCRGTDCDDFDPLVSGTTEERCGNGRDDDCDGAIDERDCVTPAHDRCGTAFEIDVPGSYAVSTAGAGKDYAISCEAPAGGRAFRELVLGVTVSGEEPRDIDIVAKMPKAAPAPQIADVTETTFDDDEESHAVAMPDSVSARDVLLVLFANATDTEVVTPDGWAELLTVVDGDASSRTSVYTRVANGTESGTSVVFSTMQPVRAAAQVMTITGSASTLSAVRATGGPQGSSAAPDPPAATTPWSLRGDNLWIAFSAGAGAFSVAEYPSTYRAGTQTSSGSGSEDVTVASAMRPLATVLGDPGPFALEAEVAWAAGTIVVQPSSRGEFEPGEVVLAATESCGDASAETACEPSVVTDQGDAIARLVLRNAEPGTHAIYLSADREAELELHVDFREPEPAPTNETCGTATELTPGKPVRAVLAGLVTELETACSAKTGDLVYGFELSEASDVRLQAVALDEYGKPVISLRDASCVEQSSELTCRQSSPVSLYARALPAGSYAVGLSGTGPTEAELVLTVDPATEPPASQGCDDPPLLTLGDTQHVTLDDATDAVQIGCLVGAPDATYALELDERSDVMLVQRGSDGDTGGVLIASPPCASEDDASACYESDQWPVRAVAHGVGPGPLRAVVETAQGKPTTVTAFSRPAANSVFVQGADECDDALEISPDGGRFEGNTDNQYAQYDVSCDYGGQGPGGAPEQLLRLDLAERRRVILDARGSNYQTIVVVRSAEVCPGEEIAQTCSVTYTANDASAPTFSFVDTELEPGSYFIQIDGYNGDKGRWVLEVFSAKVNGDQGS